MKFKIILIIECLMIGVNLSELQNAKEGREVEVPATNIGGGMGTTIFLGTPKDSMYVVFDLQKEQTMFSASRYTCSKSLSHLSQGRVLLDLSGKLEKCEVVSDIIEFKDTKIKLNNYSFYCVDEDEENRGNYNRRNEYSHLSLAYNGISSLSNSSLVYLLQKNNLISRLSFTLNIDFFGGNIYFGDPPKRLTNVPYSRNQGKCKIDKDKWGCYVTRVRFMNKTIYKKNTFALFNSNDKRIFVPEEVFQSIGESYFEPLVKKHHCTYVKYQYEKMYHCQCHAIEEVFPDIFFSFEEFEVKLPYWSLFDTYDGTCFFVIEPSQEKEKFIFGSMFLMNFINVFDHENRTVTFYEVNSGMISKRSNLFSVENIKKGIYILTSFIAALFVAILTIIKRNNGL